MPRGDDLAAFRMTGFRLFKGQCYHSRVWRGPPSFPRVSCKASAFWRTVAVLG
jgi:hypothetical protein